MNIDRAQVNRLNTTLHRADALKARVQDLAGKVAKLDNCAGLDTDPAVDRVTVQDTVPVKSALGRLFSSEPAITGQVASDPSGGEPNHATLETSYGFLSRARYQLSTDQDGSQTVSLTQLHPIGEELLQSYTFLPNGTIAVNADPGNGLPLS